MRRTSALIGTTIAAVFLLFTSVLLVIGPGSSPAAGDTIVLPTGVQPSLTIIQPTSEPSLTLAPTIAPTILPTIQPTVAPTIQPTISPTISPPIQPTVAPTVAPTTVCQAPCCVPSATRPKLVQPKRTGGRAA